MNTVILLKTHVWNHDLEAFVKKIRREAIQCKADFFVLMHTEDDSIYHLVMDPDIKDIILRFKEADIKKLYNGFGFHTIWMSNHWILMWFYRDHQNYQYYWSLEYDVRICGNSINIWKNNYTDDFLYTIGNFQNNTFWNQFYRGKKLTRLQKYHGYLQIARYSNRFIKYLDTSFSDGEQGQDEMITYSLLQLGKFTNSNKLLYPMIRGTWSTDKKMSDTNRAVYDQIEKNERDHNEVYIFHPIK